MLTRSDFDEGSESYPDLWGPEFAELEARISKKSKLRRPDLRKRLADLERRRRSLEPRMLEAAHEDEVDWEDVREELEDAVREFKRLALDTLADEREGRS